MGQVCWWAQADGSYWIDIALGNRRLRLVIDTGIIDPQNRYAFEIDPALYDSLRTSGQLSSFEYRTQRVASGHKFHLRTGLLEAQLLDPATQQRVGPLVQLYTGRRAPSVPNRVGTVFFHHLTGCRVLWDLDSRSWCVEYP